MKKIFTITESERESILSKHNSYKKSLIKEQLTQPAPTTQPAPQQPAPTTQPAPQQPAPQQPAQSSEPRFKTATCAGLQKGPKCVDNTLKLQIKINDTCPPNVLKTKLVEDGVIGTNTRNAIAACDTYIRVTPSPSGPGTPAGVQTGTPSGTPSGSPAGASQSSSSSEQFDSLSV